MFIGKPSDRLRKVLASPYVFIPTGALLFIVLTVATDFLSGHIAWSRFQSKGFWAVLTFMFLCVTFLIWAAFANSEAWLGGKRKPVQVMVGAMLGAMAAVLLGSSVLSVFVSGIVGGFLGYFAEYLAECL